VEPEKKQRGAGIEQRRAEVRMQVDVAVEITTMYHRGGTITERTYLEDLSDNGCRFTMRGAIRKGDTVSVHLLAADGETLSEEPPKLFEVMWIARADSVVVVGARIIGGENFDVSRFAQGSSDKKVPVH
jgi:hypothetical protein